MNENPWQLFILGAITSLPSYFPSLSSSISRTIGPRSTETQGRPWGSKLKAMADPVTLGAATSVTLNPSGTLYEPEASPDSKTRPLHGPVPRGPRSAARDQVESSKSTFTQAS